MKKLPSILLIILLIGLTTYQTDDVHGQEGTDHIVYLPMVNNNFDSLWQFSNPIRVKLDPAPFSNPFLIIDSDGRPHIFWDTWSSNSAFIYHTYLTNHGWSAPTPISQTLGKSELLNPPVSGEQNNISLVWYNQLNAGGPFRILYNSWDGSDWATEQELLENGKSIYINGMVRYDSQGIPNVSYIDTDGFMTSSIYFQKWTGSGFSPRQSVNKPPYASLVWLDSNSGLHFFGDDFDSARGVHYSWWKNGSFLVFDRSSTGRINSRHSLLDNQNNLHLVRQASVPVPGGNITGVYHQCLKNDSTWSPEQVISGQIHTARYRLAYNNLLQPILAWTQNDNTRVNVAFWDGCALSRQKEINLPDMPGSSGWGELVDISENTQAGKVCVLSKEKYSGNSMVVTCNK